MIIKSLPHLSHFRSEESGIKRVIEAYFKYLPTLGYELADLDSDKYDLLVAHAGMADGSADVAHLHGLYWTADYNAPLWEYDSNRRIVRDIRHALAVTVPSSWVAESLQRDLKLDPFVLPHGIDFDDWQHNFESEGYVLWNKNRDGDVCTTEHLNKLAARYTNTEFISTFGQGANVSNLNSQELWQVRHEGRTPHFLITGVRSHGEMRRYVQQAGVYLSTTKETFGIGVLEALASGVPVLGYNHGGNVDLIEHGFNGYLADDFDDLCLGLEYCFQHRDALSLNARKSARAYTWQSVIEKLDVIYKFALERAQILPTVGVVIPVYNKTDEQVERALRSVINQTYDVQDIVLVNDASTRSYDALANKYGAHYIEHDSNRGVANARNTGIRFLETKYVCCLDSDDWLDERFVETCVSALEQDRTLSIAYTGLTWHKPDGSSDLSDWPTKWNFDEQLKRRNQVPTCCVFTREMWARLGGYKQRYAPTGAGAEDAEFWTRAGAYGFKAAKVSNEGLFHYSWLSGHTSQESYHETDWLAWHPWARDHKHPFGSRATAHKLSHPVRQYDEPIISVIIPVGEHHLDNLRDALDSLEAQGFRKWEAIVVFDFKKIDPVFYTEFMKAYPYVHYTSSDRKGAGYARNRGAELARGDLLLFLDADDTLHVDALEFMLQEWSRTKQIVYTDYVGQAFIEPELAQKLQDEGRLQSYNGHDGEAIISYKAFDFDCARALRQPEKPMYIWCNISSLVPKVWHDEIEGFDESMETWEDWDYWLRLVRAGKCFTHLRHELLRYRFYTGTRRDVAAGGGHKAQSMIEYLRRKYEGLNNMGCNCKDKKPAVQVSQAEVAAAMSDENYVKARYTGRRGNHHIIGAYRTDFDPGVSSRKIDGKWAHYYGYASAGHVTLVHKEDLRLMVGKWEVIPDYQPPEKTIKETPPPKAIEESAPEHEKAFKSITESQALRNGGKATEIAEEKSLDLQQVPGVTSLLAKEFEKRGLTSKSAIKAAGVDGLKLIKGVGDARAKMIIKWARD